MKTSSLPFSAAAAAVLAAAVVAAPIFGPVFAAQAAQTAPSQPQSQPATQAASPSHAHPAPEPGPGSGPPREFPAPKNLKVLPKSLTGKQVHDIMEGWSGALGVHCDTCHAADPGKKGPNGRPMLKFADDSKPEKGAARVMYTMTHKINDDYISTIDMGHEEHEHQDHAHKATCGTCHRGHLKPEAYVPPKEHEEHRPALPK